MDKIELLFIRHGESTANAVGKLAGRLPSIQLSAIGIEQARSLRGFLSEFNPDRIISSPIERCLETAKIALNNNFEEIQLSEKVIEMDYGDFAGQQLSELAKKTDWSEIQLNPGNYRFPNGESFAELLKRTEDFLIEMKLATSKKVVVFTHADVIKSVVCNVLDVPMTKFQCVLINPGSITHVQLIQDQRRLMYVNNQGSCNANFRELKLDEQK